MRLPDPRFTPCIIASAPQFADFPLGKAHSHLRHSIRNLVSVLRLVFVSAMPRTKVRRIA
jgi:hypothetical protein